MRRGENLDLRTQTTTNNCLHHQTQLTRSLRLRGELTGQMEEQGGGKQGGYGTAAMRQLHYLNTRNQSTTSVSIKITSGPKLPLPQPEGSAFSKPTRYPPPIPLHLHLFSAIHPSFPAPPTSGNCESGPGFSIPWASRIASRSRGVLAFPSSSASAGFSSKALISGSKLID